MYRPFFIYLLFISYFFLFSCKKDLENDDLSKKNLISSINSRTSDNSEIVVGGLENANDTLRKQTILGVMRDNPYTVENFTAAYNELYDPDISSLPTTHYYYKFTPTNSDELKLLVKSGFELYDYDLRREVIEMGDYFPFDTLSTPFGIHYVVIPVNQTVPIVPNQKLADLHLRSTNETLVRKALERKGYNPDVTGYIIPDDGSSGGGGGDSGLTTNSCGCQVYSEGRKPGGCVKVFDTDHESYEGVNNVKIIMKDTWLTEDVTWTSSAGCWKINSKYYGNAWMWVKFSSNIVQIRGTTKDFWSIVDWAFPIKHYVGNVGKKYAPTFNNIPVTYEIWTQQGSFAHVYWGAATVNNALYDLRSYNATDGVLPPPTQLDIFVGRNNGYGYTLMNTQYGLSSASYFLLSGHIPLFYSGPFLPIIGFLGAAGIITYMPDVYIGINTKVSRGLKSLAYHELAHASHSVKTGNLFWYDLVFAEINASIFDGEPHGNSGSYNAKQIALCESWAEFISINFFARTYPVSSGRSPYSSYAAQAEGVRNEFSNHIPIGFYNDLMDTSPDVLSACDYFDGGCGTITDGVSGFSIGTMYNALTSDIVTPFMFLTKVTSTSPPAVKTAASNLFLSY